MYEYLQCCIAESNEWMKGTMNEIRSYFFIHSQAAQNVTQGCPWPALWEHWFRLMADLGLKASLQQISVSVGNVGAVYTDTHLHTHRLCCTRYPVYLRCRISHLSSHTSVVQLLRIAACCFKPSTTPASTFRLWRMCTHHSPISMCIIFVGRDELWAQKPN